MSLSTKRIVLVLLSLTLFSVLLLSISLSNLQLHAGLPFPGSGDPENTLQPVEALLPLNINSSTLLQGFFALIFLILLIYVPARLIALVNIKKILIYILSLVILATIITLIPHWTFSPSASISNVTSKIPTSPSYVYPTSPLGKPPQAIIWFVLIGLVLGVCFLTIMLWKRQLHPTRAGNRLLQEAETAINALKSGEDFKNVIVRCYLQMTFALQAEQGFERNNTMTVREFENWLEIKGVPRVPVHHLTYLFEKVRYGKQPITKNDEKMGVDSLNEIIQFSRRVMEKNQ